jgi:hypothetical protein
MNKAALASVGAFLVFSAAPAPAGETADGAPKTTITGEKMNILSKGDVIEFSGDVKMVRGEDVLTADRVRMDEKTGLARAWGRVHLTRRQSEEGLLWEAWADAALYDSRASSGTLWGTRDAARLMRSPLKPGPGAPAPFALAADRVTLYQEAVAPSTAAWNFAHAVGRVHVNYEDDGPPRRVTDVWAGRMFYDGSLEKVRFTGGYPSRRHKLKKEWRFLKKYKTPLARQREDAETRFLTGRLLRYHTDERRLVAEGDVKATVQRPPAK